MSGQASMLRELQLKAAAEVERRKREGRWVDAVEAHEEYQDRPIDWMVEKLGIPRETLVWSESGSEYEGHKWDGDSDPFVRASEAVAGHEDVAIESATGTGKTFWLALLILWFEACHKDALVVTVAPKEDQLLNHVWKEIGGLWSRFKRLFPDAELYAEGRIRMRPESKERDKWTAYAFVCGVGASEESATKAQGFHAEHMLIITEETPGIHPAIMNSLYNTRTDDHNLQVSVGNPDNRTDQLHQFSLQEGVRSIRISAYDHPNIVTRRRVVPGAIGAKRLEQRVRKLGKGTTLYQSRVRGISPSESAQALIRWDWCRAAAKKWSDPAYRAGKEALGVDVAQDPKGDKSAIARFVGACLTEVESFRADDAREVGEIVYKEMLARGIDPRFVGVDSVGVGASTVNELKRLGVAVRWINGGSRSIPGMDTDELWSETSLDMEGRARPTGKKLVEAERFDLLRSQIWWRMREDLRMGRLALPDDEELFEDLCAMEWETRDGKIVVEKKDKVKSRIGRSPDKGDAAVMGNWVRRRVPLAADRKESSIPEQTPDRDRGLEHLLERMEKEAMRQKRTIMRSLQAKYGGGF